MNAAAALLKRPSSRWQAPSRVIAKSNYLEPHHIRRVSDGGPDHPRWVAAICPNCHREVHFGASGSARNAALGARLGELEDTAGGD